MAAAASIRGRRSGRSARWRPAPPPRCRSTATVETTDAQVVSAFVSAASPLETVARRTITRRVNVTRTARRRSAVTIARQRASASPGIRSPTPSRSRTTATIRRSTCRRRERHSRAGGRSGCRHAERRHVRSRDRRVDAEHARQGRHADDDLQRDAARRRRRSRWRRPSVSSVGDLDPANNSASPSTTIVTRPTSTTPTIAASVTAGELTPVTVVVTDVEVTGTTHESRRHRHVRVVDFRPTRSSVRARSPRSRRRAISPRVR